MGKHKSSKTNSNSRRDVEDKPSYAADYARSEPKPEKPKQVPADERVSVEDALGALVKDKLAVLKAQMEAAAEPPTSAVKMKGNPPKPPGKSAEQRLADDDTRSFAALFDPAEEDEASFDEMLKDSKLDWHHFKR